MDRTNLEFSTNPFRNIFKFRIDKPALLKKLFELGCLFSGQILSYNKMQGQLHKKGNANLYYWRERNEEIEEGG